MQKDFDFSKGAETIESPNRVLSRNRREIYWGAAPEKIHCGLVIRMCARGEKTIAEKRKMLRGDNEEFVLRRILVTPDFY